MNAFKNIPLALLALTLCATACRTKRHTTHHTAMRAQQAAQVNIQRDSTTRWHLSETGSSAQYLMQRAIEIKPEGTIRIYHQAQQQSRDSSINQEVNTIINEQLHAQSDQTITHETSEETQVERSVQFRYGWLIVGVLIIVILHIRALYLHRYNR